MQQYVRVEKGRLEDAERRADTFMKAMIEANERVAKLTDENERLRADLARSRPTASGGTEAERVDAAIRMIDEKVRWCHEGGDPQKPRYCEEFCENFGHHTLLEIRAALAAPADTRGAGVGEATCPACEDGWGRTQDHACTLGRNGGIGDPA